jgi:D-3-phosphoglycerate dehydrogenase / 2-oxoglutarate reductase
MLKVLVTDHVFTDFDEERAILAKAGAELEVLQCKTTDELLPRLGGVHGILNTYLSGIGARVFDAAPDLRAVVRFGIGVDTIDIPAATERRILVANVPDYCIDEVADHAMALFLSLVRKLPESDRRMRTEGCTLANLKPLPSIQRMRAGIIGFGRIGRAVAKRLQSFGVEVVFSDPAVPGTLDGCKPVNPDDLLANSDAIFVQCPATKETHHLLNDAAFACMKKSPILINCARAEVVDTPALVRALREGRVRGAGLDLVEDLDAPQPDGPGLKSMDNVILTPHSAWFSDTAIPALKRRGAELMADLLLGKKAESILNPEIWPGREAKR